MTALEAWKRVVKSGVRVDDELAARIINHMLDTGESVLDATPRWAHPVKCFCVPCQQARGKR